MMGGVQGSGGREYRGLDPRSFKTRPVSSTPSIRWLDEPEAKDYLAAESFLRMVLAPSSLGETVVALHAAPLGRWTAKDILRAAGLPPLRPKQIAEVAEKLKK